MRRRGDQRGLTVVYLALSITTVMLAGAFAVDLGWWYVRAQQAQRTADAAALAGVVWMPGDFAKATATARETARANGFEHGVNSVVEVSGGTNSRQLAVRITDGNVGRFFSSLASSDKVSIGRRAVAQYELPVPLGGPENQLGGGLRGVHLAVNGYCTRRSDGDHLSSAYYHRTNPANAFACPLEPYETAMPAGSLRKNPDYRRSGYTYVVSIPGPQSPACSGADPPVSCSKTTNPVTIELLDRTMSSDASNLGADQQFNPTNPGCTSRPSTTTFRVHKADTTPLDDTDNPPVSPAISVGTNPGPTGWQDLHTVPAGSDAGRYQVRVASSDADRNCSAWSNAFGIRARVGGTFSDCSTLPLSTLPVGYPFCPQVHGLDAMSLRVTLTSASPTCVGAKESPANLCASFFLAQVDPVYAGRRMVITLFDPDEGARRLRILAPPKPGFPNGTPVDFSYETTDEVTPSQPRLSSSNVPGTTGLFVGLLPSGVYPYNDRKIELSVRVPDPPDLTSNGGWFKIEYEVTSATVKDRTTWGVAIRGAPVRLVA